MQKLINDLRDELRQELKTVREAVEREFRAQMKALRTELRDDVHSMDHMNAVFEDIQQNFNAMKAENAELKDENSYALHLMELRNALQMRSLVYNTSNNILGTKTLKLKESRKALTRT